MPPITTKIPGKAFLRGRRVSDEAPVRTGSGPATRRVGVVVADLFRRRVMIDHGIHGPGGDRGKEPGATHDLEGFRVLPVRLGDNPDPETLPLQEPGEKGDAESGVVDVGVAGDEKDVKFIPAPVFHFCGGDGEE